MPQLPILHLVFSRHSNDVRGIQGGLALPVFPGTCIGMGILPCRAASPIEPGGISRASRRWGALSNDSVSTTPGNPVGLIDDLGVQQCWFNAMSFTRTDGLWN